jgi:RHS repeat-associated protein
MVASLGSIRGLLVQSVVGQTTEVQKIYYFINDHLGTPQKLLDENAGVVWSADYKPFGEADVNVSIFANQFRLPGQYFDAETGLHYNWFRYYDPSTGRYLRADPIGLAGMDPNIYGYVLNDPVNAIDPLGLWSAWGGGSIIGAWGPWGRNRGGGVAWDSGNGGAGLYGTSGSSSGAGASAGMEVGFFTGSMSGKTDVVTLGGWYFSLGFVTNDSGDWGFVFGAALGAPVEGTLSENVTDFLPFSDMFPSSTDTTPCP